VAYGGNNFNDFPDNQLTKIRVLIGWSQIFFISPLNFYKASRFVPPSHRMDAHEHNEQTDIRTYGQTDVSLCPFVSSMEFDTKSTF